MRALLIDAMGTLVALEPPVEPLRAEVAQRFGITLTAAQAGAGLRAEIAFYRRHMARGRDSAGLRALRAACAEVLRDALPALAGVPGPALTEALLGALRFRAHEDALAGLAAARAAGAERVIAVSNWDCSLPDVLARVGLADRLDGVVASARVGAAKPDPAIFRRALALAAVPPAAAVHVGDSVAEDVAGARAAGVAPVLLARDGPPPEDPGCPVIAGLGELADLPWAAP